MLTKFRCPADTPTAGEEHEFEFCINQCPHQCQPTGVLAVIARHNVFNPHRGKIVTPTALNGCQRKLKLERTRDYAEEPQKLYYATRGGLLHGFLETTRAEFVTEQRIYKTVDDGINPPWEISGQLDFYDTVRLRLEDYKTMSDKGMWVLFNSGAKPEHVQQANIYRWLMWGGRVGRSDGQQVFWPVEDIVIHHLFMNRVISTGKTHVEYVNDSKPPNYGKPYRLERRREGNAPGDNEKAPDAKGVKEFRRIPIGRTQRGQNVYRLEIDIPKVPLLPLDEVEAFVKAEGQKRVHAFENEDHMPDGVMHDRDKSWQCDYCGVKPHCDKIEQARAVFEAMEEQGRQAQSDDDLHF